jgi:hypothetical protein
MRRRQGRNPFFSGFHTEYGVHVNYLVFIWHPSPLGSLVSSWPHLARIQISGLYNHQNNNMADSISFSVNGKTAIITGAGSGYFVFSVSL